MRDIRLAASDDVEAVEAEDGVLLGVEGFGGNEAMNVFRF